MLDGNVEEHRPKTYKREFGVMLILVSLLFLVAGAISADENVVNIGRFLFTPSLLFAAAAFGMDSYARQFPHK